MRCPICNRELAVPQELQDVEGGLYRYVEVHRQPHPHALLILADESRQVRRVRETDSLEGARAVVVVDDRSAELILLPHIRLSPLVERSVVAHLKGVIDGVDPAAVQLVEVARRVRLWTSSSE